MEIGDGLAVIPIDLAQQPDQPRAGEAQPSQPLAAAELLMIRLLMTRQMKNYRPNIIATMRKA